MSRETQRSKLLPSSDGVLIAFFERVGLNSIQRRQTAIAFIFIVGTAVVMGVVGFRFTVKFENERYKEHFNLMASYLASNAELGVLLGDEKILQGLTESMLAVEDVQVVEMYDLSGSVIIRRAYENTTVPLQYITAPVVSTAVAEYDNPGIELDEVTGEDLGVVRIGYSLTGLESLKKQLAVGFLSISLLLAVVPVFLYWRLSRTIRAPLKEIMQVASAVSGGDLNVRAEVGHLQETRTLSLAFNEMLDALQQQRQQIKEANEAVSRQQVLAEVGKFSMMMAHEIKNPLSIIKGSLDVLFTKGPVKAELQEQMVGFLNEEIKRINKLVEDFLDFARPGAPAFQSANIRQVINSMEQRAKLIEPRVVVEKMFSEETLKKELSCDLALLERALLNLLRNALEASKDIDAVKINASFKDGSLRFSVLDNGPGLNPEDLESVFEPFFSKKAKGTGLGLAIAKSAVTAHNGEIYAENLAEGGACFVMAFPLEKSSADDDIPDNNHRVQIEEV